MSHLIKFINALEDLFNEMESTITDINLKDLKRFRDLEDVFDAMPDGVQIFEMPVAPDYEEMSISQLAAQLRDFKQALDKIGSMKTELQKMYDYLSIEVLPDRMDEEGIDTIKVKNVGRLQTSSDIRCSVPANNKDEVKNWLRENGHGSMISEAVNASTLKAFVKEMMKENKPYPEHLLNIHAYSRATVVKG
jgi:hypothetical protein